MNQRRLNYCVLSWNVRGLGQSEKCDAVRDTLTSNNPHIACIQESKLAEIDSLKSRSFLPSNLASFLHVPAEGSRGGILTAWDGKFLIAGDPVKSRFSLSVPFTSTTSPDKIFLVTNVYAPSDHRHTDAFLSELVLLVSNFGGNHLILGDFNLIRCPEEKNSPTFDAGLASRFNNAIDAMALIELPLLDRSFTWTDKRDSPVLARLDRAFINLSFSSAFPNSSLTSRISSTSDHVPLVVSIPTTIPKTHLFRFENLWLKKADFFTSVLSTSRLF
jgi:exonuclease III